MTSIKVLCISSAVLAFSSCSSNMIAPSVEAAYAPAGSSSSYMKKSRSAGDSQSGKVKSIVKSGSLAMQVQQISSAVKAVETIVLHSGGEIKSVSQEEVSNNIANLNVLVKAERLDAMLNEISEVGKVTSKRLWVRDQSKSVIDALARIEMLKSRKARLKSLLSQSKLIADKIELDRELTSVESELYRWEQSKQMMQDREQMSELQISMKKRKYKGPVGAVLSGISWGFGKLFVLN
ncbi:DUF4349 domain-containing protein [Akkermansiaceae bacterium]|nr:DUF4349 domain-containing protein [Akkermansiaceae bacterium]